MRDFMDRCTLFECIIKVFIQFYRVSTRGGIMKAQTVNVKESAGRVLSCTIFRPGGRKLLAKGHVISAEDTKLLEIEGLNEIWVTQLEEGEVGEDEAVMQVASEM